MIQNNFMQMKKLINLIFLALSSCARPGTPEYYLDGKYVKDEKGRIYKVEHRVGSTVILHYINKEDIINLNTK